MMLYLALVHSLKMHCHSYHQRQNEERAQIESLVMSGIQFLVEYAAGVVKGTIGGA